jgi:uncharacterized protein YjiS (DUF1127 family)
MTFTDFVPTDRPVRFTLAAAFRAVAQWLSARREARAKLKALKGLLFEPEFRLRDMGISREDVIAAIEAHRK